MAPDIESPLLEGLTDPQIQAATHVDGPILVLAGPGSGKTRVITSRVAQLVLGSGIAPWHVLAVTFTNKAAGEMRERVGELVSERQARAITISTFHSLCARIIRQYAPRVGLAPGYSIYDSADQQRAMKQALKDLEINPRNFSPRAMLWSISDAKSQLLGPEKFAEQADDFYSRTVAKVYGKYAAILKKNDAVDFDDLLMKTVELFREHRDVLDQLRERFRYVMIDEYQDTNHAQFLLAHALAAEHQNIMATGDPDQSIYGWRGANIKNILDFEQHFPGAKVVRLEQNYRSTGTILAAADALIRHNTARKHKALFTANAPGQPVRVVTCRDERHEAKWLIERFRELHENEHIAWGQMAVFYRMNSLSRVVEEQLREAGVPYQIARGTAFYDRKEIKDAVAYLRVVANPADEVNLLRVINTPARGISDKTVEAVQAHSLAHDLPVDQVMADPMKLTPINTRAQNALAKFERMVTQWRQTAGLGDQVHQEPGRRTVQPTLALFVQEVLQGSGLEAYYENDKSDPDQERLANLGELVTSADQFEQQFIEEIESEGEGHRPDLAEKLLGFLERISLVADLDAVDPEQGALTLMTLHAAKGLEFAAVAVIGVEDKLLPHERSQKEGNLEEERRLCFVGMTRAERYLFLTHARYRTVFGQTMPTIPSRFLGEIPDQAIQRLDVADEDLDDFLDEDEDDGLSAAQRAKAKKAAGRYPPGTRVRHPQFGLGRVLGVSAMGAHTRARVDFTTGGVKTLILQYARLERVE